MRYTLLSILFLFGFVGSVMAQPWSLIFPGISSSGTVSVTEIIECPNNDLIVVGGNGNKYSEANGFVMRINPTGELLWYKEYIGAHTFESVMIIPEGGFLVGGVMSEGYGYYNAIMKIDDDGNVLQVVSLFFDSTQTTRALIKSNHGFIGFGQYAYELNHNLTGVNWLQQLQPNGRAFDIEKTVNGFVTAGFGGNISVSPWSKRDISLSKIDNQGNLLWSRTFGGMRDDFGQEVEPTIDNGILICGITDSYDSWVQKAFLIKTDSLGEYQWGKTYTIPNGGGSALSMLEDNDGNIYIGGGKMLFKTNAVGEIIWSKRFNNGTIYSMVFCAKGKIAVSGENDNFDFFVSKFDSTGNADCSEDIVIESVDRSFLFKVNGSYTHGNYFPVDQVSVEAHSIEKVAYDCQVLALDQSSKVISQAINIYPNPASNQINLEFGESSELGEFEIYNLQGGRVSMHEIDYGKKIIEFSLLNIPDGIYFYNVVNEYGTVQNGKLVIAR